MHEVDESDDDAQALGKREQNKANKQRRILEAARELFESRGFDETTTAEISELAGVGTGTLYLYVSSKEQLLFDVFAEDVGSLWRAAFDEVDRRAPVADALLALFASVSRYHADHPKTAATYFLELGHVASKSSGGVGEMMRLIFDGLEQVLVGAQADGRLEPNVDAAVLAHNLFAIWNYVMVHRFSHPETTDQAAQHRFERSLKVALTGLVP